MVRVIVMGMVVVVVMVIEIVIVMVVNTTIFGGGIMVCNMYITI